MAEVKPTALRSEAGSLAHRVSQAPRLNPGLPLPPARAVEERVGQARDGTRVDAATRLLTEFSSPSPRTASWLSDPRFVVTLQAASEALAPGGRAEDAADRYAASVIETHLVARRRLSTLMNALLKT